MPTSNPLPPKENTFFKRILKCYEQKQYKNGLKFAKQILANPKYSEHGETLAMKGLTLNCLGRKEEAYDHVRRGLRNDLRSHVCWHVYGLLQRSDRKYDEAIKCYVNALKWDKDNPQILKDLALLQIQVRDLEGYRDTRYQLLISRPNQRQSWIGYAMSNHLMNRYDLAISILDEFRKTASEPKLPDYEMSELVLYQNMLLREAGEKKQALKHLEQHEKEIVDKLATQETKAQLYLEMDRYDEAAALYRTLIARNPENWNYYSLLEQATRAESEEDRMKIYDEAREVAPRSAAPQLLPLSFVTGERFRVLVDKFLRKYLSKGVPPLFVQLRGLYKDPEKVRVIEELLLGYLRNLKEYESLVESEAGCGDTSSELKEPPTTQLWTNYFLAEHYDHLGQHKKAIEIIDQQIEHTPTLIELHILKGRVFKHAMNITEAVRCLDEAQSLDTADRYINCKCAKYMLRASMIKEAEEMCAMFTREGVPAVDNLNEMQCMWFQTECAAASRRLRRWGDALKKCHEIDRHFTEIVEDQFDFHMYCARKFTLRSYMGLLRLEDQLRAHPFYFKAAKIAIEIYVHLYDAPITDTSASQNEDSENLSPSELKKLKNKQRRAEKKAAVLKERAKQELEKKEQNKPKPQDVELDGPKEEELVPDKLEKPAAPLEQAVYFLKPLLTYAKNRIETHCLAFEIYSRKGKMLLMLQAIKRGHRVDGNNPHFHRCSVKFLKKVRESKDLDPSMQAVLDRELEPIYGRTDPQALNRQFLQANINSYPHIVAGAHMMYYLDETTQAKALQLVTNFQQEEVQGFNVKESLNVLESLERGDFGACQAQLDAYKDRCRLSFPYALPFQPPTVIANQSAANCASANQDSALAANQNAANCAANQNAETVTNGES